MTPGIAVWARFLAALLMLVWASAAVAVDLVNKNADNIAIKGYDPVAYFLVGEPMPGAAEHVYEWRGATWHFSNARHREMFASDPNRYAPRYGGFCAGGMALGMTVSVDPEAWVIVDGKLYLNYSKHGLADFKANTARDIAAADKNWTLMNREDASTR